MAILENVAKLHFRPHIWIGFIEGSLCVWGLMSIYMWQNPGNPGEFAIRLSPALVCDSNGSLSFTPPKDRPLPLNNNSSYITINGKHIPINYTETGPVLRGEFEVDANGYFITGDFDGEGWNDDKTYLALLRNPNDPKTVTVNYHVTCEKQPTPTPTPKPPATPKPQSFNLKNSHYRLTAINNGFHPDLTKPAGKGRIIAGRIFSARG
jgi:hypothetical protein